MLFPSKINEQLVRDTCDQGAQRFPGLDMVVLHDQPLVGLPYALVDCRSGSIEQLEQFEPGTRLFIYACDQDDLGLPFVERLVVRGDKFLPAFKGDPGLYTNFDATARRALEDEYEFQVREGFAKFEYGPHDFVNITQALNATRDLPGDYVEIGCFAGSSSGAALRYLRYKGIARTCWFLDVFDGFTYEAAEKSSDAFWAGGHQTHGRDFIEARLKPYEARHQGLNVRVVKANIVTDELPEEMDRICVANVDVDLYEAVYAALVKVHPRMVAGGVVICEDAGHTPWCIGARLAFEQFIANEGAGAYTMAYMQSGQAFLIRRHDAEFDEARRVLGEREMEIASLRAQGEQASRTRDEATASLLASHGAELAAREAEAVSLREQVESLRRSTSWRVTAPLRGVRKLLS